jgi:hypothetical protein
MRRWIRRRKVVFSVAAEIDLRECVKQRDQAHESIGRFAAQLFAA